MISAIFVINSSGNVIISRIFREEVKYTVTEIFYSKIINNNSKDLKNPILTLGSTTFLHVKQGNLYYLAVTRNNSDASIILQYLTTLIKLLKSLIFSDNSTSILKDYHLMNNFLLVYELLGLTIDQGFVNQINLSMIKSKLCSPITQASVIERSIFDSKSTPSNNSNVQTMKQELSLINLKNLNKLSNSLDSNVLELFINEYVHAEDEYNGKIQGELVAISTMNSNLKINFKLDKKEMPDNTLSNSLDEITVPSTTQTKDNISFVTDISKNMQAILNYTAEISFQNLPVTMVGSYTQLARNKFNVSIEINTNYSNDHIATYFTTKIPIPKTVTEIVDVLSLEDNKRRSTKNEFTIDKTDGYIIWELGSVTGGQTLKFNKIIYVDLSNGGKLSDWISTRGKASVQFQVDNLHLTGFSLKTFNIDGPLNDVANKLITRRTFSDKVYEFSI